MSQRRDGRFEIIGNFGTRGLGEDEIFDDEEVFEAIGNFGGEIAVENAVLEGVSEGFFGGGEEGGFFGGENFARGGGEAINRRESRGDVSFEFGEDDFERRTRGAESGGLHSGGIRGEKGVEVGSVKIEAGELGVEGDFGRGHGGDDGETDDAQENETNHSGENLKEGGRKERREEGLGLFGRMV